MLNVTKLTIKVKEQKQTKTGKIFYDCYCKEDYRDKQSPYMNFKLFARGDVPRLGDGDLITIEEAGMKCDAWVNKKNEPKVSYTLFVDGKFITIKEKMNSYKNNTFEYGQVDDNDVPF